VAIEPPLTRKVLSQDLPIDRIRPGLIFMLRDSGDSYKVLFFDVRDFHPITWSYSKYKFARSFFKFAALME